MSILRRFSSLWNTLLRGGRLDQELDEELNAYLEALVDRKGRSRPAWTLPRLGGQPDWKWAAPSRSRPRCATCESAAGWKACTATCGMGGARSGGRPASPWPRSRRSRSASAPTPPSSASPTRCSSSRCRSATLAPRLRLGRPVGRGLSPRAAVGSRVAGPRPAQRPLRRLRRHLGHHRRAHRRADPNSSASVSSAPTSSRCSAPRPPLGAPSNRGTMRRAADRGAAERRGLAAPLRQRSRHRRQAHRGERPADYRHRRDANRASG